MARIVKRVNSTMWGATSRGTKYSPRLEEVRVDLLRNENIPYGVKWMFKGACDSADLSELVEDSISQIQQVWSPGDNPLYVCFSGGKDSIVLLDLVRRSGVPHISAYNVTTVDPPEVVRFIKDYYPEVTFQRPRLGMDKLIRDRKMLPTRKHAFCCDFLKERIGPHNHIHVLGVRREESPRRRRLWPTPISTMQRRDSSKMMLAPILEWPSDLLWKYIHDRKLPYCSLYNNGWQRIGCVGCPMISGSRRMKQFEEYPRIWKRWRSASDYVFAKICEKRELGVYKGKFRSEWSDADSYWNWWLSV